MLFQKDAVNAGWKGCPRCKGSRIATSNSALGPLPGRHGEDEKQFKSGEWSKAPQMVGRFSVDRNTYFLIRWVELWAHGPRFQTILENGICASTFSASVILLKCFSKYL